MSITSIFVDSASLDGLRHGGLNNVAAILSELGHKNAADAVEYAAIAVLENR